MATWQRSLSSKRGRPWPSTSMFGGQPMPLTSIPAIKMLPPGARGVWLAQSPDWRHWWRMEASTRPKAASMVWWPGRTAERSCHYDRLGLVLSYSVYFGYILGKIDRKISVRFGTKFSLSLSLSIGLDSLPSHRNALYSRLLRHSSKEPHGKSCHVFMSCFVRKTGVTPRTVSILNSKMKVWFRWFFFSIEWLLASKCEFSRVYLWWVLCDWVNGSAGGRGEGTQCTQIPRPCGHWFLLPHEYKSIPNRLAAAYSAIFQVDL